MRIAFILSLFAASFTFAGNCGTDQFLTGCNPANTASLPNIGTVADSNQVSMRTGNGEYRKASAYALASYVTKDTTFIDTVRGMTTKPVVTVSCTKFKANGWTVCSVPSFTGTSNTTALTIDAFPSGWRPAAATRLGGLSVTDNSVVTAGGSVSLGTDGVPTFSFASTGGVPTATFTNSGTKAASNFVIQFLR